MSTTQFPPGTVTRPAPGSHIADPAPLGLAGFALTTFVFSVISTNIVNEAVLPVVFGLTLAYGGLVQLAAGLWEFARGNTFGATAFCSYGGFWISYWYLTGHTDLSATGKDLNDGLGLFLLAWGIFTLYMSVAASKVSLAVLAVFVLLTITFFAFSIAQFETSKNWTHVGGYLGILTAIVAWYASFAGVTNSTYGRTVIPTGVR